MTPDSPGYREMCRYFTDVNVATVNDWGATFHAYDPECELDSHIDYCFVDKKVIPVCQRIMREAPEGKYPSDHYGLFVKVRV